ncbi:hypothetical protein H1R20_g3830, partial [Candolleomyces eurysporus]
MPHFHRSKTGSVAVQVLRMAAVLSAATSGMSMSLASHQRRAAQTNAVCAAEYAWADTLEGAKSPCQVAAELLAPCNGGNWVVPALNDPAQAYTNPNATTANPCSCSWAVYNLLSACSDCQGMKQAIRIWSDYKTGCPGAYLGNTTHYPIEFLPNEATVPFWATTDPSKWLSSQFNAAQARPIAEERHADVKASPQRRNTPVGAIAGGVVGGLVLLLACAGVAYHLLQKRKKKVETAPTQTTNSDPNMTSRGRPELMIIPPIGYTTLRSDSGCGGPPPITRTHSFSLVRSSSPAIRTTYSTPSLLPSPIEQESRDPLNHPDYNPPAYDFSGDVKDRNMTESGFPRDMKDEPDDTN